MTGVDVRGRKDCVVDLFCYEQLSTSSQSNEDFEAATTTPETPRAFGRSLHNIRHEPNQKRLSGVYSVERGSKRRRRLDFSNIQKEEGVEVVDLSHCERNSQSFDGLGGSENKENKSTEEQSTRKTTKVERSKKEKAPLRE